MRSLISVTCLLTLLLASTGCSGDAAEKEKNETAAESNAMQKEQPAMTDNPAADSLADKRFEIRSKNNQFVTISTDFGDMVLELYRDAAPAHADSFAARAKEGFYDGLTFHRIVKHFMIQGGDPAGNGTGNAGYFLNAEFNELPHQEGTLSMARGPSPNSASCQFFICLERNRTTQSLDGQYTVFGQLVKGFDTLHKIGDLPVGPAPPRGEMSKPNEDVYMRKVFLSDSEGNPL